MYFNNDNKEKPVHILSKFQKFLIAAFAILILSVSAADAEPSPLTVRNETGQDISLKVIRPDASGCTEGTYPGFRLRVRARTSTVWQLGRNSAIGGCVGRVCVRIQPADDGRDTICFDIHGGTPIVMLAKAGPETGRSTYPNFQIISANQNWGVYENWLTIGGSN